uniref:Amino acid transporter transmembrane domain-containing protein n=1 Tax=Coccolithus braarudii TaxID=221442 RepID=A0A7S0L3X4_9EUKA|mmetsp:Transcript_1883/g.4040  ORF Transcript_1883/g.4040 Transcript_1883/m.4040 type:complete len:489 (+) Transcript_1883:64-1530(+)
MSAKWLVILTTVGWSSPTAALVLTHGNVLSGHTRCFGTRCFRPRLGFSEDPNAPPRRTIAELPQPQQPASLLGATALVAGTTVGAGILALPAKTLAAGFAPSTAALLCAWLYMASSGLLIAEVNVNTRCAVERSAVSLNTMVDDTLGSAGSKLAGLAYLFIHYTLLVAYMLQGGTLLLELLPAPLSSAFGAPLFAAGVGGTMFLSTQPQVERFNNVLVAGVILTFISLLVLGAPQVDVSMLGRADAMQILPAIPVLVLSLVFHNVIPTIAYQLRCDIERIRYAIIVGSLVPTLMFISWDAVILGVVPFDGAAAALVDPLAALRGTGDVFGSTVRIFSVLAIITSFVGFVYGLVDFLADAIGWDPPEDFAEEENDAPTAHAVGEEPSADVARVGRRLALYAMALLPPLLIAESDPSLFFAALDNAGTFGILVLFGILPPLMVWQQRYGVDADPAIDPVLPGGRVTLGLMAGAAAFVVGGETLERISHLF